EDDGGSFPVHPITDVDSEGLVGGDLDGDGDLEVVVWDAMTGDTVLLEHRVGDVWTERRSAPTLGLFAAGDVDGDGAGDLLHRSAGVSLARGLGCAMADTDDDGLHDAEEWLLTGSSPTLADTDGGGVSDGAEVARGTDPRSAGDD
ncbi:MAG: hypothetical protein H6735_32265, partial [Alphaproteobacteria bacterium]|nr:hypothetical protein [Alphaproteobacteria bacterium]